MSRHTDTIAALATPAGTAAIAVLRVSGPDTAALAAELGGGAPRPRVARHTDYRTRGGEVLDDVLLTYFAAPRSYTGEDSLEISCHGNPFIAQKVIEDLFARGCRPAEPGEFTQRAFLNGKMDLSQAEAVMDLIHARSDRALAAANRQLRGGLALRMETLIDGLLNVLARIEAYIDFPDEDLPTENQMMIHHDISVIILTTNRLLDTYHFGSILRDGIKTVIIGAPNAGKSSLLNRLVGKERALVSAEPGTTRDFIEERILVGPHCVRLTDTAGLNASPAPLEQRGIEKTLERAAEADLFLVVIDASAPPSAPLPLPADLSVKMNAQNTLLVHNKVDLVSEASRSAPTGVWSGGGIPVSALTGFGLEALRDAIAAKADAFASNPDDLITINARHAQALREARDLLNSAAAKLSDDEPVELVASDLRGALAAFGEISGRVDNERMLDRLFATFCIGK
ncbi:MAG: tRNA uridine-5-carboxymethylaminomethyl(34) synthesis GTPase MnmE [Opitutus sp.]|nr:tRNA uridine-5-carboxymethylaminomethyl(34) synthesis GTPase MnmE [Opitutus sp.]